MSSDGTVASWSKFKFHCDSINMSIHFNAFNSSAKFKFHCDSINIHRTLTSPVRLHHLNSTVILLILVVIVVVLVRYLFKFHCDSINIG